MHARGIETQVSHADPGMRGVVPFRFACHRCGHCCSGGSGHVWLEDGEVERMADRLGCTGASFEQRFVRDALDPVRGVRRRALRETEAAGGRCALLAGRNTCSVYDARPEHCRTFPYWESVLTDRAAFESARATCPGIAVEVDPALRARAFADLAAFISRYDAQPATCCLDAKPACDAHADTTYATALEADWATVGAPTSTDTAPSGPLVGGTSHRTACRLGERRPLACRLAAHDDGEGALRELRAIERAHGYPAAYAPLAELLKSRGPARTAVLESVAPGPTAVQEERT